MSRSEKKRRAKGIEELVSELAALPRAEIEALPCDKGIRDEIASAQKLKGGARKRQIKHATKLLRDMPVQELFDFLARKKGSTLKEKRAQQKIENLRNLLLTEAVQLFEERTHGSGYVDESAAVEFPRDSGIIRGIARELPGVDESGLINTAMQFARTRNRKFSRELYRIMKAAMEKAQFTENTGQE